MATALSNQELIDVIGAKTVLELADLIKLFEDKFGVKASAPVAVAAVAGAAPAAVEEKTEFTVMLQDVGPNKIKVVKVIREITGLGLKEAKDMVDNAPKPVKENIPKAEAEDLKKKIEAEGAKVTIK